MKLETLTLKGLSLTAKGWAAANAERESVCSIAEKFSIELI
jgi:hypothetical protein